MSNDRGRAVRSTLLILLLPALLLLAGCSVREQVELSADGSGTAELDISLHPIMVQYMSDLMSAMTGVEGEFPIFDTDQIAASFAERENIELTRLERRARGAIRMNLRFDSIEALAEEEGTPNVFAFSERGGRTELTLTLDGSSVRTFMGFAPDESERMAEFMLPPDDGSVTAEEYREEMAWALEEYEDRPMVESVLDASMIEVRVVPEGRIIRQSGGRIDGDAVVFAIPVIELLTLRSEVVYSLVFEP